MNSLLFHLFDFFISCMLGSLFMRNITLLLSVLNVLSVVFSICQFAQHTERRMIFDCLRDVGISISL